MIDLQTFLSWWNDVLALPILILMSASVPPCFSTLLPKYVKFVNESTYSRGRWVLCSLYWPWESYFWLMMVVFSCIWCWVCESKATSSAKSKSSRCFHGVHWITFFLFAVDVHIIQSQARGYMKGDSRYPCLTPVRTWKESVSSLPWTNLQRLFPHMNFLLC